MATTAIRIDYENGQAVYRQMVDQFKVHIASGKLIPGAQLPSIRSLADTLKVNPRTVVKAYEELEREQLVVSRQGQGVFVAKNRGSTPRRARTKALEDRVRQLLANASGMGASMDEVLQAIDRVGREMNFDQGDFDA